MSGTEGPQGRPASRSADGGADESADGPAEDGRARGSAYAPAGGSVDGSVYGPAGGVGDAPATAPGAEPAADPGADPAGGLVDGRAGGPPTSPGLRGGRVGAAAEAAHAAGAAAPERSSRRAAAIAFALLAAALAAVIAVTTPWHPLPGVRIRAADPSLDFTRAQIARAAAFNTALDPPAYAGLVAGLVLVLVLGLTPLGARPLGAVTRPLRRAPLRVVVAAIALSALTRIVALPFDAWSQSVLRRYGLSTRRWDGWLADQLTSYGVALVVWIVALLGLHLLARRFPRRWWIGAAAGGFVLVVAASFVYPVAVEPLFNSFTPMRPGPLRTDLLGMARADGVPVRDVLVADASKRTTELNAYVSGFGSTRRIVVYDTLLDTRPRGEIELIVAHELGHAKRDDVLTGTLIGGLGVAAGVCLLYLVMTSPRLLRRAGAASVTDPRSIALLLASVAVLTQAAGPVQNLVSRHIEARADAHALNLTRDPATFVAMQRSLSVRNLDDLSPDAFEYALWNTHPTGPQRIAMGRAWARLHHVPVPPPLSGRR